jgi:hypothetical protein
MLTSAAMSSLRSSARAQSGDSAAIEPRTQGEKQRGDAGNLREAAPPAIGRRNTAGDEERRRPGRVYVGAAIGRARGRGGAMGRCSGSP